LQRWPVYVVHVPKVARLSAKRRPLALTSLFCCPLFIRKRFALRVSLRDGRIATSSMPLPIVSFINQRIPGESFRSRARFCAPHRDKSCTGKPELSGARRMEYPMHRNRAYSAGCLPPTSNLASAHARAVHNPLLMTLGKCYSERNVPKTEFISPGMHFPLVVWLQHFGAPSIPAK
jgi:hypothetical protein